MLVPATEKHADILQLVHVLGWQLASGKGFLLRQGQAPIESKAIGCSVLQGIRGNRSVRQCRGLDLFLR